MSTAAAAPARSTPRRAPSVRSRCMSAVPARCGSGTLRSRIWQRRVTPAEQVGSRFRAQHFEDFYYGWSAAAGDFNHDGVLDLTMGNRSTSGPTSPTRAKLYAAQAFNPAKEYTPAMVNFAFDYTGDGWDDILVVESRTPALYVNPKGRVAAVDPLRDVHDPVISESISFKDVNGDGKPDAIYSGGGTVAVGRRRTPRIPPARGRRRWCRSRACRRAFTASAAATSTATGRWTSSRRTAGGSSRPPARHSLRGPSTRPRSAGTAMRAATSRSTTSTATSCRTSSRRSPPTASGWRGTNRSAMPPERSRSSST